MIHSQKKIIDLKSTFLKYCDFENFDPFLNSKTFVLIMFKPWSKLFFMKFILNNQSRSEIFVTSFGERSIVVKTEI